MMDQVAAGDTVKGCQPVLEAAVPAIDMVQVDRTARPYTGAQVDGFVGDAVLAGKCAVRCTSTASALARTVRDSSRHCR